MRTLLYDKSPTGYLVIMFILMAFIFWLIGRLLGVHRDAAAL